MNDPRQHEMFPPDQMTYLVLDEDGVDDQDETHKKENEDDPPEKGP